MKPGDNYSEDASYPSEAFSYIADPHMAVALTSPLRVECLPK